MPYKETEEHSINFAKPPPELIEEQEEYEASAKHNLLYSTM
jgi:hypothetical protein